MISPKNKLRICFLFVVFVAASVGIMYYYYAGSNVSEWGQGTLITILPRLG